MDPLVSLHYYAPVCSLINACFLPFTEGWAPFRELPRIGLFIMSTNALVAFGLNVSAVFLISAAGGLVLTLAGVFKDILLITASVVFFGSPVTLIQVFGKYLKAWCEARLTTQATRWPLPDCSSTRMQLERNRARRVGSGE